MENTRGRDREDSGGDMPLGREGKGGRNYLVWDFKKSLAVSVYPGVGESREEAGSKGCSHPCSTGHCSHTQPL